MKVILKSVENSRLTPSGEEHTDYEIVIKEKNARGDWETVTKIVRCHPFEVEIDCEQPADTGF